MTRKEKAMLAWQCFFGNKSTVNTFGKIVLFPFLLFLAVEISLLELLFSSDD